MIYIGIKRVRKYNMYIFLYICSRGKDASNIWANIAGHAAAHSFASSAGGFLLPVLILFPAWLIRIRRINWTPPPPMQRYKSLELNCEFKVSIRQRQQRQQHTTHPFAPMPVSHSYQPIRFEIKKKYIHIYLNYYYTTAFAVASAGAAVSVYRIGHWI